MQDTAFSNGSNISLGTPQSLYSTGNNSTASLRRTQSPSRPQRQPQQQQQANQQQQQLTDVVKTTGQVPDTLPLFMCEPFIKTALVKGSYKTIVQQPKYVDQQEWLALNVFEFYNHLNKFYGVISEYVTADKYPTMKADPSTEYVWIHNGRANSLPAHYYIDYALTWISNKLNDQTTFPTKTGTTFPPTFINDIKGICKQIFRIIAHIYWNHFEKYVHLSLEAHWISYFSHFISFVREFDLLDAKELAPLGPLIENLQSQGRIIKIEETAYYIQANRDNNGGMIY